MVDKRFKKSLFDPYSKIIDKSYDDSMPFTANKQINMPSNERGPCNESSFFKNIESEI